MPFSLVPEPDEVLTTRDVATLLKYSPGQILEWVHEGKIPYIRVGREFRFLRSVVMDWFATQMIEPVGNLFPSVPSKPPSKVIQPHIQRRDYVAELRRMARRAAGHRGSHG